MPGTSSEPEISPANPPGANLGGWTVAQLLGHLRSQSIDVQAKDGKLLLNAPAGVLTAELQNELRARKSELLSYLAVEVLRGEDIAPLSYAQQRLWLIERLSPGTIAYNVPQSWRVSSGIDLIAFRGALKKLSERHSVLRTAVELRQGEPLQIILKDVEIPVVVTDLSLELDRERREARLARLLIEEGQKEISLNRAPLIRFQIIRLASDETVVSYSVHHIIVDQWSLDLIKRDLFLLYEEESSGKPSALHPLPLQYAEIARREKSEAVERIHAEKLSYWRERLANMPMVLELPFSKTRPAQQTYIGKTHSRSIDPLLTKSLRQYASRNRTSLYLLMLTMFSTLVYRYTGQKNFCIGTPTSGRKHRDEEEVIGLFVNMVPVRCVLNAEEGFEELLRRMTSHVLADFDHGDVPFQKLVTDLQVARSSSYSPVFQISFALNPKRPGEVSASELQDEIFIGISKFDLTLQITEHADTLDAHFEFRTDLFAEGDVAKFAGHFLHLCHEIMKEPNRAIARLPLLVREDVDIIQASNRTGLDFDRAETLNSLFTRQVLSTPASTSLCCGDSVLTYQELDDLATRLAGALQSIGVKPESFVAICLDRSPQLIVAILAVLKTGAGYLPLDPKYPADRVDFMLEDSGAQVLIMAGAGVASALVNQRPGLKVVDPTQPEAEKSTYHFVAPDPESAAYLIYTSGSTGKPKGVVVEHRNAVALIAWARNYFDPTSLRGMLASTSVCFDLSVFEIFLPLVTGNTIILVDDILALPKSVHAHRVTLINSVPSAMNALLQSGLPANVLTVCMAGEYLPAELVDRVYAAGAREVIDLYGPTETTTYSTVALRGPQTEATIGKPIANTCIYLVDHNLELVPPGLPGEILIGGEGVARGYLNRPELTVEKFVFLPQIEPRSRLYRTGDIARQREDGMLIYLGRRDQQIKLRGHRVELGEIEAALRDITGASQTAVVVQKTSSGDSLAAFLVQPNPDSFDPSTCRKELLNRLPAYMVPGMISVTPEMPLTPNGKVDRKLLMQWTEKSSAKAGEPPADLLEQWLANIWSLRLGKMQVARDAHFFDELGGHSLVAFEIFMEIERRMGTVLMLAILFQAPTIESLAAVIRRHGWNQPDKLRLLKPGIGGPVRYLLGQDAVKTPSAYSTAPHRIMIVESRDLMREVNVIADEIAAYEASNSSLILEAAIHDQRHAVALSKALTERGFKQVSTDHLET